MWWRFYELRAARSPSGKVATLRGGWRSIRGFFGLLISKPQLTINCFYLRPRVFAFPTVRDALSSRRQVVRAVQVFARSVVRNEETQRRTLQIRVRIYIYIFFSYIAALAAGVMRVSRRLWKISDPIFIHTICIFFWIPVFNRFSEPQTLRLHTHARKSI